MSFHGGLSRYVAVLAFGIFVWNHHLVQSLNVKPVQPTITTTFNATVELQWQVTLEPSETILSLLVRELPGGIKILSGTANGLNVDQAGRKLFGDRVSGIYNKSSNIVTLTLRNILHNETLTFQVIVGSSKFVTKPATISIVEISAFAADVTTATPVLDATYGTTVSMQWKIILDTNQIISTFNVRLKSQPRNLIISGGANSQIILNKGKELFGRRLSAVYDKIASTYTVSLKNIQYNESLSFQLITNMDNPFFAQLVTIEIKNVTGSPGICGNSLKSGYNIIETASLTVTQDICGHPKPIVKWKLEEDNTFSGSFSSVLIDNASRKYRYSFATRNIIRSHCGKKIMYNAGNEFGKVEGNSTIYISFKPSKITLTSSYRHNASWVYLTWHKEDTGNCLMDYHLKFDDKDDVYSTFNTNFSLCHSPCASSASVWASYKGNVGYKNNITLRSIPTRLDTTIMPSSRTTTEGTAAQIEDDCKCASKNAISIVITIVIGLILNIVIFVILKHKGFIVFNRNPKKTLQHTERRDDDNYEVTETTSSHYADLNVKSVKPSIYADLTTDSSKEYAEIELNETKQNMYANINT